MIKAEMTLLKFGLVKGKKYGTDDGFSESTQASLVKEGLATYIQQNEIMQSEVDDYQEKSYPKYFLVIKDGSLHRANVDTSDTWVASEWDLKIKGVD